MSMLAMVWSMNEAAACGGFACDVNIPVLQNAERIVFGLDGEDVEMHVQITYEGAAEEFAWIVPVPADPDIFITTTALFDQLQRVTAPIFTLQSVDEGNCNDGGGLFGRDFSLSADAGVSSTAAPSEGGGVQVVAKEDVGPYETVTLQATSVDALMTWLDANHYNLPPNSEAAISPYVAPEGAYFVALRLQKDKDVGDLAPLGLRYPGDKGIIPVQLTSVSAVPDMRMEVYVFGPTRAVPESYLHVQINEAAVDWWNFGQNYFDVITEAADQAGGHAFATDSYTSTDLVGTFFFSENFDEAALRGASNATEWVQLARQSMGVVPPEFVDVLVDQLGLTEDEALRITNPYYYSLPSGAQFTTGANAATDDLIERVIEPLRAAQRLVDDHARLSRMTSSLDAVEMTVDPVFVLNPDMLTPDVSSRHTANQVFECGNGRKRSNAPRRLELANGISIEIPSQDWFAKNGMTEIEYIDELGEQKALVIEETGASGQPTVLVDHTADLVALVSDFNSALGCGCDGGGAGGSVAGLGALAILAIRRREGRRSV